MSHNNENILSHILDNHEPHFWRRKPIHFGSIGSKKLFLLAVNYQNKNWCNKNYEVPRVTVSNKIIIDIFKKVKIWYCVTGCLLDAGDYKIIEIKKCELGQWTFCGTHIQKSNTFESKTFKK